MNRNAELIRFVLIQLFFLAGSSVRAEQVVIDIEGGICGDCCTMKLFAPGVRNVLGADKGKTIVTLEYDAEKTNPSKIIQHLDAAGKKAKVVSAFKKDKKTNTMWVKPKSKPITP